MWLAPSVSMVSTMMLGRGLVAARLERGGTALAATDGGATVNGETSVTSRPTVAPASATCSKPFQALDRRQTAIASAPTVPATSPHFTELIHTAAPMAPVDSSHSFRPR